MFVIGQSTSTSCLSAGIRPVVWFFFFFSDFGWLLKNKNDLELK